jgi:CheY-like chemotaxis protein
MTNTKTRILCVDDNPCDCELIKTYLGLAGFEVVICAQLAEALRLAVDQNFDLYLIDLKFPEGSGTELSQQIRRFDEKTPILFHSASAFPGDLQAALIAGAQGYITKPSDPRRVVEIIQDSIENAPHHTITRAFMD